MDRAERRRQQKVAETASKGATPPASFETAKDCLQRGRPDDAVKICRAVLDDAPDDLEAWCFLGTVLHQTGQLDQATDSYRQAIRLNPDLFGIHSNLGAALIDLGRNEDAVESFRAALSLNAENPDVHNNLAVALMNLGRLEDAEAPCRDAIALAPNNVKALNTLGNILTERDHADDAAALFRRALDIDPNFVPAHMNLGRALANVGAFDAALDHLQKAVALQPGLADARYNLGIEQLRQGDFAPGWANYAWRRRMASHPLSARTYDPPVWDGGDAPGQTLYLYNEQGLGDALQFVRFAASARRRVGRIVLEARSTLHPLLEGLDGIDELVEPGDAPPAFDCHAALMDLPGLLALPEDTVSRTSPYLHADPALVATWSARFPEDGALRVGIVWSGNPGHRNDRNRSLDLELFAPLATLDGVTLYSLQIDRDGDAVKTLGGSVVDLGPEVVGFSPTAAAMMHLDVVVTVDTSVAHLAGALGRPVWTLLSLTPDWRWGTEGDSTPWYPTMRLFRQRRRGDWADVVARVREGLVGEER